MSRHHMQRPIALAAAAVASALALAACGTPANGDGDAGGPVTITYESWAPTQQAMDEIIAAFEAENPDITVQAKLLPYADYVTAIKTELASGTAPDVFAVQSGGMLAEFAPLLTPLDDLLTEELGADWKDIYQEAPLSQASYDGVVYGLPHGWQSAGTIWVNNTLLEQHGVAVPTDYDELVEASAQLRAAGVVPLALGAKDTWMDIDVFKVMSLAIAPGEILEAESGEGRWDSDGLVETFQAWSDLFTDGVALDGAAGVTTYTDAYDLYLDGKAGFFSIGSWNQDMFVTGPDKMAQFESSVIQFPTPAGDAPVISGIAALLAINGESAHKAAALELAQFISSGPGQQILINHSMDFSVTDEVVTPEIEFTPNATAVREQLTEIIDNNYGAAREIPNVVVKTKLGDVLLALAAGSITPEDAAAQVQAAAEEAAG